MLAPPLFSCILTNYILNFNDLRKTIIPKWIIHHTTNYETINCSLIVYHLIYWDLKCHRRYKAVTHLKPMSAKRIDILSWTKQGSKLHFPHSFVSP